jgi:hypothetical protein
MRDVPVWLWMLMIVTTILFLLETSGANIILQQQAIGETTVAAGEGIIIESGRLWHGLSEDVKYTVIAIVGVVAILLLIYADKKS